MRMVFSLKSNCGLEILLTSFPTAKAVAADTPTATANPEPTWNLFEESFVTNLQFLGGARFHHNFNAVIFFVAECFICIRRIIELQPMSDHKRWVNLAALNPL